MQSGVVKEFGTKVAIINFALAYKHLGNFSP